MEGPEFGMHACRWMICMQPKVFTCKGWPVALYLLKVPIWYFDQGDCGEEENSSSYSLQQDRQSNST